MCPKIILFGQKSDIGDIIGNYDVGDPMKNIENKLRIH